MLRKILIDSILVCILRQKGVMVINMKIAVAGTGYVGLSIATLLSQHHEVVAVDIIPEKVKHINHSVSNPGRIH